MESINNYSELIDLKNKYAHKLNLRKSRGMRTELVKERNIMVCGGTGCKSSGSDEIINALNENIEKLGLKDSVKVIATGCFGFCARGPIMHIQPDNIFYTQVTEKDVQEIVFSHLLEGNIVQRLLYEDPETKIKLLSQEEMPFYKKQNRIALRNCGIIDPENIEEVIASGGYQALGKAVSEMTQDEVINEVKISGLRGRGGGGFPTGRKWEATKRANNDTKYVICNADEGDPGAFMDRAILEGDPHSVIEAMAICGYSIGSSKGFVYIRAEYPLAVHRLKVAISQAKNAGLLGENILGSNFNFDIEIKYGAGAFVCGEATALIHSIEGMRGEPTMKPPRTSEKGLWLKPTCVNNVETFSNIAPIINNGGSWYASIGTPKSTGTKVFALAGKINNVGLVEVPMGITLREIIYEIGGGIKDGKALKAVQSGGPSGGCIPASLIDTPIEYETLLEIGSMMGSGGMIVMDEDNCMVDIAKFYMEFIVDESCGKCTPCRVGNKRLLEILNRITDGKGSRDDLSALRDLSEIIQDTSLCGLGQSAPNPVLSTMNYFTNEYMDHIVNKKCASKVCKNLLTYTIEDNCIGCTKCARNCPVHCIKGKVKEKHEIDIDKCIKCGTCFNECPVKAVIMV
ncbi:NADH-quinone oxidoreductase subunit NuoF [Clostridium intestinale]|uniref:Hydrogenase, electron-transfer subunit n=2 Tax=Clostridium intestinale URNW TaxID=1294142 RepID=U2N021_9CLOT|nr:NADH-quinone oxidoreductase subunit NuoF [Clostridium intestinale]ERK28847.1 hydrogenase, electron-transfer subunit [Clostridium intestinale URNW]